jgi:hypothetical protein
MAAPEILCADPTTEKPTHARRWIPLSLRMFIAIQALFAVVGAVWVVVPAWRQNAVIREIEGLHGFVAAKESGPKWLRKWMGNETMRNFDEVYWVDVSETQFNDDGLRSIQCLRDLTILDLRKTKVTDAGHEHVPRLTKLRVLFLDRTRVTDSGLKHLTGLRALTSLTLYGTPVTDAGVSELQAIIPQLEVYRWP